ncbi:MAG: hypothetical protein E6J34_24135, partial [Chloroflexi bacterium]
AAAQREQEIQRLAGQEANHPCDLAVGPLLRTALLRLAEQEHVMLLTLHHIITDGWSMEVLVHEMSILYQAEMRREPAPLPKLAIQYADYALWQHQWLQGEVLDAHIAYWKRQLAGAPTQLHLPTDRPRPAIPSSAGAQLSSLLPLALLQQLRALSQREGVTLFMTGFAAFNVLLHYYTGQEDLVVGTGIANRNRIEIEGLIGFLVNQLALRTDLSGNPSFVEVMQRVRKVSLEAYAHQDLPFERLVEALNPERNLSYTPLFQVKFILQNVPAQKSTLDALTVRPLALGQATAKFDILLSMSESSDGLFLSLEYRTDLFNAETMKQFLRQFEYVMYQIVALPEIPLERIRQALAAANREAEGRREQDLQQMSLQKLGQVRRVRNVKMPRVN